MKCPECQEWTPYGTRCVECNATLPDQMSPEVLHTWCHTCQSWSLDNKKCPKCGANLEHVKETKMLPASYDTMTFDGGSFGGGVVVGGGFSTSVFLMFAARLVAGTASKTRR